MPISQMTANQIFRSYVRFIGVGAIATAGIFGIIKSLRIVAGSFAIAARAFRHGEAGGVERTDRDIPVISILAGVVVSAIGVAAFLGSLGPSLVVIAIGCGADCALLVLLHFVAANAIATTARNPVSGMTMLTIISPPWFWLRFGLSGTTGMFFVMAIAGMGVYRPLGIRADHHGFEDRLLARSNSRRPGEGEVSWGHRRLGRCWPDDRAAGPRVSIRRRRWRAMRALFCLRRRPPSCALWWKDS